MKRSEENLTILNKIFKEKKSIQQVANDLGLKEDKVEQVKRDFILNEIHVNGKTIEQVAEETGTDLKFLKRYHKVSLEYLETVNM